MAADPTAILPGLCGGPLGWAGWTLVVAAQATAPNAWRTGWSLAAIGVLPAAVLLTAPGASPAPLAIACMLLAGSLVRLGALGGQLAGERPAWLRAAVGAALVVGLVLCDGGAQIATGTLGHVLDGVAPGPALGRAANGTLDLGVLLTVSLPGLWAAALSRLLAADTGSDRTNEATTALLVPVAGLLALAVVPPSPPLLDGTPRETAALHSSTVAALHRLDRPLMTTVLRGGPLDQASRATERLTERLLAGITRNSLHQVSTQRPGPTESRKLLQAQGLDDPGGSFHGLNMRSLDRAESLLPLPSADRLQEGMADGLWRLGEATEVPTVLVVGATGRSLGITRPVQDNHPATAPPPEGAAAMVVPPADGGLSRETLRAVDEHVMRGGSLVVLYGNERPEGAPSGVALTNSWGFYAAGAMSPGVAEAGPGEWGDLGFGGLVVPSGAPAIIGPDGLGATVASVGSAAVAIAMLGSVPSGFENPDGERAESQGAVRAFFTSAAVAEANPGLTARALDWVLDEAVLSALRGGTPARTPRSPMVWLLLALVPGLLVGAGAARAPGAVSEPN